MFGFDTWLFAFAKLKGKKRLPPLFPRTYASLLFTKKERKVMR